MSREFSLKSPKIVLSVGLFILATLIISLLAMWVNTNSSTEQQMQPVEKSSVQTEEDKSDESVEITNITYPNGETVISCSNKSLKLNIMLPRDWSCTGESYGVDGWMRITSELFEINISNMGRGPFCTPYTENSPCKIASFASTKVVELDLYSVSGVNKEIWGIINSANPNEEGPMTWVSVKYSNMEEKDLSDEQKQQLLEALNTITIKD